jgi:uncharacterized protein
VAQLLGGLTPEAWDGVVGPNFYSTARWLDLCAMHGGADPGAAVHFTDGEPTAVVPFAALSAPPSPLYRWNDLLAQRGLPRLQESGLLVGPRQGYRTQFLVRPGGDRTTAFAHLVAELRDQCRGAACVAAYVPTADAQDLLGAGVTAQPVLLEADAWLPLPSGGWDAWLGSFTSRRRRSILREAAAFRDAGYTIVRRPLTECYEQLPALAGSTQAKYGHVGATSEWLALLKMHVAAMGSSAQVALCMRGGGDPVGFCLYYVWGETLFLRWGGLDYTRLAGAAEYFNVMYYSQIEVASELGVRWMHAGIKSSDAKALRGAELRPLWLVDLAEDSPLARERDAVRRHNRNVYDALAADSRTSGALSDVDGWSAFS